MDQKDQARSKHIAHHEAYHHHVSAQRRRSHEGIDKSVRRATRDHRRGLLRFEPKKSGGGGKFTWGRLGDEANFSLRVDAGDPTYDAAEDDPSGTELPPHSALTPETVGEAVKPIIAEYFDSGNAREAGRCLFELDVSGVEAALAAQLVLAGLEQRDAQRELISKLLSDLHAVLFSLTDLERAFDLVLEQLADVAIDVPDAPTATGKFIARAVGDDILAPRYVQNWLELSVNLSESGLEAINLAHALLSSADGILRLHTIWGISGPFRPVNLLIQRMQAMLTDFFVSGDRDDVERSLADLRVPYFHHEFAYEAIVAAMDAPDKRLAVTLDLLQHLYASGAIAQTEVVEGLARVASDLPDLVLDVPHARDFYRAFLGAAADCKLVPPSVVVELASRSHPTNGHNGHA